MDDSSCLRLSGECQEEAGVGKECGFFSGNQKIEGVYVRGACLSSNNPTYLCCATLDNINPERRRVLIRSGNKCRTDGGICLSTSNIDALQSMNSFCDTQRNNEAFDTSLNRGVQWVVLNGNSDCLIPGDGMTAICCGPAHEPAATVPRRTTPISRSQVSTNECASQAGSCIPEQDDTLERYRNDYHEYCKTRSGFGRSLGKCQQPSQQFEGITYVCCVPETAGSLPSTISATPSTLSRAATTPAQSRGTSTQCRTNDDCEVDVRNRPFCQNGFCTACADRDGNNPRIPSYIAEVITVGFEVDLDECKIDPESNKYLEEKICRNLGLSTDPYNVVPDVVEWNCRIVMNNPSAMCLTRMTNKGMAGYCGIPDNSIPLPEVSPRSIRRGSI